MPINSETTVYVASAWFQFCDPFVRIVGLDQELVTNMLNEHIEETIERDELDEDQAATIMWPGEVFAYRLGDIAAPSELPDAILDLSDNDIWYPDP